MSVKRRRLALTLVAGFLLFLVIPFGVFRARDALGEGEGGSIALAIIIGIYTIVAIISLILVWKSEDDNDGATWWLAILQVIVPMGPIMGIPLVTYIRRHSSSLPAIAAHIFGSAVFIARDLSGLTYNRSAIRTLGSAGEQAGPIPVDPYLLGIVLVVGVALPIISGYWLRTRDELGKTEAELADSQEELAENRERSEFLADELRLKEEREGIAREIHDTIGHKLSLVNLYAGSLEVSAAGNSALQDQAKQVRKSAQEAVDDLRELMTVLKTRGMSAFVPSDSLADLARVIDDVASTGHPITSTVMIDDPSSAPTLVTSTTYRVIQEILTNAVKHAPSSLLRLAVTGGPDCGIHIRASNEIETVEEGAGHGLAGMSARLEAVGGTFSSGVDGDMFRCEAFIPWR